MSGIGDGAGGWAPVVYGRTRRADFWWRAVPAGLPYRGWLSDAVQASVGGGQQIGRPRFLLSRSADGRILVGVACRAAELSERMNSHERRQLYCFVGWTADAAVDTPTLDELRRNWRAWAGPVYREWVGRDWDEHPSRVTEPRQSEPGPAPWNRARKEPEPAGPATPPAPSGDDSQPEPPPAPPADDTRTDTPPAPPVDEGRPAALEAGPRAVWLEARPGSVWLLPGGQVGQYWAMGLAAVRPYVLVTDWAEAGRARRKGATHICADDATLRLEALSVSRPRPGVRQADREQSADSEQRADREQRTDRAESVRNEQRGDRERQPHGEKPQGAQPDGWGPDPRKLLGSAAGYLRDSARAAGELLRGWAGEPVDEHGQSGAAHIPSADHYEMDSFRPGAAQPGQPGQAGQPESAGQEAPPGQAGTSQVRHRKPSAGPVSGRTAEVDPEDADYDDFFK